MNVNGMLFCLTFVSWNKVLDFKVLGLNSDFDEFYQYIYEAIKVDVASITTTVTKAISSL